MRRILLVAVCLVLLNGAVAATETGVALDSMTVTAGNVIDKLLALVGNYTKRVDEALSMEELEVLFVEFEKAMAAFSKENAGEIAKFDADLTAESKERYEAELSKAIKQFKSALEKKAMKFRENNS